MIAEQSIREALALPTEPERIRAEAIRTLTKAEAAYHRARRESHKRAIQETHRAYCAAKSALLALEVRA